MRPQKGVRNNRNSKVKKKVTVNPLRIRQKRSRTKEVAEPSGEERGTAKVTLRHEGGKAKIKTYMSNLRTINTRDRRERRNN